MRPAAGTNFLTRSCAFAAAGWSPTYTLTEDYALGMELKKRRWQCRYVNEYLAVGEAPEQVRNCFQQRSRWAKGCAGPPSSTLLQCDQADAVEPAKPVLPMQCINLSWLMSVPLLSSKPSACCAIIRSVPGIP